jgi:hypothetical protein
MKIEVDLLYRNKATGQKVRTESIDGNTVCFIEIGNPDGFRSTSMKSFEIKYEPTK